MIPTDPKHKFRMLVQEYQQRIYYTIRKIVIDHDDTDDLVQEVFVKAWNNMDKFEGNSHIYTWIYRIAVNEALQFLRKKKRTTLIPLDQSVINELIDHNLSPSADQVEAKLQKALQHLPDKQRVVFQLRYYDEMSYEQMAEVLGGTTGSLKASYHHAYKKVENILLSD